MMTESQTKPTATDYSFTKSEANELLGAVLLPHEFRELILRKYLASHGGDALVNLFSQFIGMANSVVENSRDALWTFGIIEAKMDPKTADDINYPTIFGALNGVKLAYGVDQAATCHGCACRLGSLANQSPSTTCDVDWCLQGDDVFWCHEHMDENEKPTRRCVGFQQHVAREPRKDA
jgi:hypothetical protein